MGFFRRLLGLPPTELEQTMNRLIGGVNRNITLATAQTDPALWKLAEERKGHISPKAVGDEYNRLILEKHKQ